MKEIYSTYVIKVMLLLLLFFMATALVAQNRLSPCSKQDYELYAPILKELYNPLASQQYIVVDGESEKYALQIIKGTIFSEPTYTLAYKDLKGNKKEITDSLCQLKIASLLRYVVFSSTPFVRKNLGVYLKTSFFFDLQDGAEYSSHKENIGRGSLIDILEISCNAVKNNKPEIIRQLFPQIDSLTQHFKSFELEDSWKVSTSENDSYSLSSVQLSTHYRDFNICFQQPKLTSSELRNKYENLTQTVAKWLFLNSNILDFTKTIYINVYRDKPDKNKRFSYSYGHYYINVAEDELTEENLISLFKLYLLK